jgi:hypothetical protein
VAVPVFLRIVFLCDEFPGSEIPARLPRKGPDISHGFEAFMDFQAIESSILASSDRP